MRTITCIAVAFALSGCATTHPQSPGQERAVFTDLPAADGMTYVSGYGHTSRSGSIRSYTQEYTGSRRLEDVRIFYEKALPVHKWALISAEGSNPSTLKFEKQAERVTVRIEDKGGTLRVTVTVGGKN